MCENSGKSSLDNNNLGRIGSVQRDSMWGISAVFTPTQDCECGVGATNVVDLKSCDAKMQVRASFQRALAFEKMGDVRSAENEIRHAEKIWKRLKLGRRVGSFATRVKLKNYLDSFDDFIERLKAWVMERGYLPWARGQTVEERRLAQWASLMRASRRKLPMDKQIKLEGVRGWAWEERSSVEALSSSESSDESFEVTERRRKIRYVVDNEDEWKDTCKGGDIEAEWWHEARNRINAELAQKTDPVSRRLCLRRWQLMYHPDKNPDKANKVMPIFRWIMSIWNRDYRTATHCETAGQACENKGKTLEKEFVYKNSSNIKSNRWDDGGQGAISNEKTLRGVRLMWKDRRRLRWKQPLEMVAPRRRVSWKQPAKKEDEEL